MTYSAISTDSDQPGPFSHGAEPGSQAWSKTASAIAESMRTDDTVEASAVARARPSRYVGYRRVSRPSQNVAALESRRA